MMNIRNFHLGKKAYIVPVDENTEVLLFGSTKWDESEESCQLTMFSKLVEPGTEIDLDNLPDNSKPLFRYNARSNKFKTGNFSDFDARRYIKSRYRDFTRSLFRQQSSDAKLEVLNHRADEFVTEQNNDERITANETVVAEAVTTEI